MTEQEELMAVCQELDGGPPGTKYRPSTVRAARIILALRKQLAAKDELIQSQRGLIETLAKQEAEAQARIAELEPHVMDAAPLWSGIVSRDERIAALEAENAKLRYYDIRGASIPFIPKERIAENERLRVALDEVRRGPWDYEALLNHLRAALEGKDDE